MQLQRNVGRRDRLVRGLVGGALLLAGLASWTSGYWIVAVVAIALGLGLLSNAVTGFCSVNALLGVNTCEAGSADRCE